MGFIDYLFIWAFGGLLIIMIYSVVTNGKPWGNLEMVILGLIGLPFLLPLFLIARYTNSKNKKDE